MFSRILIAVDASEASRRALAVGLRLAREQGSEVILVHVVDTSLATGEVDMSAVALEHHLYAEGRRLLREIRAELAETSPVPVRTLLRDGPRPAAEIVTVAEREQASLIVLGTHGRSGLGRLVLGSTAEHVLRQAPCPVLTVRLPTAPERQRSATPAEAGAAPP